MSKLNATSAFLSTLALCCLPLTAATISIDDEVSLRLGFDAYAVGIHQYEVLAGGVVMLDVTAPPTQLLGIFVIPEDAAGQPDYSNAMTLFLERTMDGRVTAFVEIPPQLAGLTFRILAAAQAPEKREPTLSPEVQLSILGHVLEPDKDQKGGKD
jgi:hypothetical protein